MSPETSPNQDTHDRDPRDVFIEKSATELLVHVWHGIWSGRIDEREPIADAALVLRDNLNPNWPSDSDWLPEPLASERAAKQQPQDN